MSKRALKALDDEPPRKIQIENWDAARFTGPPAATTLEHTVSSPAMPFHSLKWFQYALGVLAMYLHQCSRIVRSCTFKSPLKERTGEYEVDQSECAAFSTEGRSV